jgi:modulator of FtsH protease HflC
MTKKVYVVAIVALGLVLLICCSVFYTVDQRELALLMHFGKPVDKVIQPGLHVKWPVISTVQCYDSRLRVLATRAITYVDQDNKPIILQAYLCWRVVKPLSFYNHLRNRMYAEEKIREIASSALRVGVSKLPVDAMVSIDSAKVRLPEIERELERRVREDIEQLAPGAVEVTRAGINRLAFPAENERAVYEQMIADREVDKEEYDGQGRQKAQEIMATANKEAQKIIADAEATAGRIRGQGEAQATEIYRKAYSIDRDFYVFWHTLKTYEAIFGPETTLVIPPDCELMKHFRMPPVGPGEQERAKGK